MATALIVLAAGRGTRMKSGLPKVLHPVAHAPMLWHVLRAGAALEPERIVVVVAPGAEGEAVRAAAARIDSRIALATQDSALGTGHAALQAAPALEGFAGRAVVVFGDTPLLSRRTLERLADAGAEADIAVLGFEPANPDGYGRLVVGANGLESIVEHDDASEEERRIGLCNGGALACDAPLMFELLGEIRNSNAASELYLTDIVGIARQRGLSATAVSCPEEDTLGVNDRAGLARAESAFQDRARAALMESGVTLVAPHTVFLAHDTEIGRDAVIEPNVVFGPGVTVESGARIRAFSHLEGCHVGADASVGPFARLRPGAKLGSGARAGNFVEIKNSDIGPNAAIGHLSYVGDAEIGARTNVGAGTITCNYDGAAKHRTSIGSDAFIGSDTMLVAPVSVGDGAMTATGTVVTSDVEAGALAIGRAPQETKPGRATRLREALMSRARRGQPASGGNDGANGDNPAKD